MKELTPISQDKLQVEEVRQIEKKTVVATLFPKKGHSCFELNLKTGEVKLAEYDSTEVNFKTIVKGDKALKHKLLQKENHIYTTALNRKNAFKHFKKILFGK